MTLGALLDVGVRRGGEHFQGGVAQRPATGAGGVGGELAVLLQGEMQPAQRLGQVHGDAGAKGVAGLVQGGRVGGLAGHDQVLLIGQAEQQGLEGLIRLLAGEGAAEGVCEPFLAHLVGVAGGAAEDQGLGQGLARFPAVEQVGIGGEADVAIDRPLVERQLHRRREALQGRDHRRARHGLETHRAGLGVEGHDLLRADHCPVVVQQGDGDGDRQRALGRLARRRRRRLRQRQLQHAGGFVVASGQGDLGCAGLLVPVEEVGEVATRSLGETGDKGLDRRRLAVVAFEIEVHALAEGLGPQQGLQHADDLRALLVDRRRVEVVDLQIARRPHRVGEGAGVLGELPQAQAFDVLDPLHRRPAHVGAERLIAEHGQAFLQAQLEPVAAGDPVAGPVVEILVGDDAFDALVVEVGRRLRVGQ